MANAAGNKPRFVPSKEEYLKFADEMYNDSPIHLAKVRKFLENTFGENDDVLDFYSDISIGCSNDDSLDEIIKLLEEHNLQFEAMEHANIFVGLIVEAKNNSRLWVNKGYTPIELRELYTLMVF